MSKIQELPFTELAARPAGLARSLIETLREMPVARRAGLWAAISAALLAATSAGMAARADHGRTITESILVPNTSPLIASCTDVHGQPNGTFGWELNVRGGNTFSLHAEDGVSDFDIAFFKSWTPCLDKPQSTDQLYMNGIGGESGDIPWDATYAIITLFAGSPGASFTYTD